MKRTLSLILAILILTAPALAAAPSVDLSAFSYDELVEFNQAVGREIMTRPEWKKINLPAGDFYGGEDIPFGRYTISIAEDNTHAYAITIGNTITDNKDFYRLDGSAGQRQLVITIGVGDYIHVTVGAMFIEPYRGLFN